jgi:hypothetical protein
MDETRHGIEVAGRHHEDRDVQIRPIVAFGGGLIILFGVVALLTAWMLGFFAARQAKLDVPASPLAVTPQEPPQPRLEVVVDQVLRELRVEEQTILHSYGWVDRQAGVVRIPIERAMTLLAERGLPFKAEARDK